ncbi:MAG: glycine cleavage system protein GcvH [Bdellovibrionota bacterium]
MSDVPASLLYTKEHEWAKIDGNKARIGITAHAAKELGDVVFVELPEVGRELQQNKTFGVVESVKAVSDLYSPLSGKVAARNEALAADPAKVNADPYGDGWMIEIELKDAGEKAGLLSAQAYSALIAKK